MSGSVNKVILIGNVGTKPESRQLPSGGHVVNFRLATNERGGGQDRSGGHEGQDDRNTQWHSIVAFSRQADLISQYVDVGQRIYLEGRLRYRTYEGKDGQTRHVTEIIVNDVTFLGGRDKDEAHAAPPEPRRDAAPTRSSAPSRAPVQVHQTADDDEIPF